MRILITGAGGFIGSKLSSHLETVHTVYKIKHSAPENMDANTFVLDLSDTGKVINELNSPGLGKTGIDLIIHCAAILSTEAEKENLEIFTQNNRITESLILISKQLNPKKIINLSTIGVYPNLDGVYDETSQVRPSANAEGLYSLAKFCSEELLTIFLKNTEVVNLRLSQTYGEGMREDRIYSLFLRELKNTNTITVWGNGERTSNFISVNYLLSTIDRIIATDNLSGTYNVGEKNISYYELAQSIIEKYGNSDSKIMKVDKGVKSKVFIDCSKMEKNIIQE